MDRGRKGGRVGEWERGKPQSIDTKEERKQSEGEGTSLEKNDR